jgi:hypothetical protein
MCFCSNAWYVRALHYSIYCTVQYIAFWDQLSKIGIFHGNRLQDSQLEKRDMAPFVMFFSLLFLHIWLTLYHSIVDPRSGRIGIIFG